MRFHGGLSLSLSLSLYPSPSFPLSRLSLSPVSVLSPSHTHTHTQVHTHIHTLSKTHTHRHTLHSRKRFFTESTLLWWLNLTIYTRDSAVIIEIKMCLVHARGPTLHLFFPYWMKNGRQGKENYYLDVFMHVAILCLFFI